MLKSGLYIIATPIGNLGDITVRALDALKHIKHLYCEDTRVTKKLLAHYGISVRMSSYHDFSSEDVVLKIIEESKQSPIGLVSDAGTPLISDPGFKLIQKAREANIYMESLPGPCAAIVALTLSTLPSDRFMFCGFYETNKAKNLSDIDSTLIFYESPRRVLKTLENIAVYFKDRPVSIHRELTKLFEQNLKGDPLEMAAVLKDNDQLRGEFVIVIAPPLKQTEQSKEDIVAQLKIALKTMDGKEAIRYVSDKTMTKKSIVYQVYVTSVKENK